MTTAKQTSQNATDKIDYKLIDSLVHFANPLVRYFRTSLHGVENLPRNKGCLIIANHSLMGLDSIILFTALYQKTHRAVRGLGEHFFFRHKIFSKFFLKLGMVDGNRENAVRLLREKQWSICYPAGVTDSFSHHSENYQLHWKNRMGYLRCALRANVSIVPLACIGPDDAYKVIGHEPFFGRRIFGSNRYDLPIFFGLGLLPFPVKFKFVFDKPIDLKEQFGLTAKDADASDSALLKAHEWIWHRTQTLIDIELSKRKSKI